VEGLAPDVDLPIRIALAKAPAERYAQASAFVRDLQLAARGGLPPSVMERAAALDGGPDPFLATLAAGSTPGRGKPAA
jgi:hypothetical protein